jgi:hypothetical protein
MSLVPPRYVYWTILIDQQPTAFRAKDQEDLLPTLHQLRRTNRDVVMKWFARGKLWESPEAERAAQQKPRPTEKRGQDWRPGGVHKDPRARFDKRKRKDAPPRDRTPSVEGERAAPPPPPPTSSERRPPPPPRHESGGGRPAHPKSAFRPTHPKSTFRPGGPKSTFRPANLRSPRGPGDSSFARKGTDAPTRDRNPSAEGERAAPPQPPRTSSERRPPPPPRHESEGGRPAHPKSAFRPTHPKSTFRPANPKSARGPGDSSSASRPPAKSFGSRPPRPRPDGSRPFRSGPPRPRHDRRK